MASVIDHYGDNQDVIIANAGPGHWNDPDMVRMFNYFKAFIWFNLGAKYLGLITLVTTKMLLLPMRDRAIGMILIW